QRRGGQQTLPSARRPPARLFPKNRPPCHAFRMADAKKRKLVTFPGLTASAFQHPSDVVATDALRSVPGLDTVVSKVMEYGFERLYYLDNVAGNVRVGPRQLPRLYRSLQWG